MKYPNKETVENKIITIYNGEKKEWKSRSDAKMYFAKQFAGVDINSEESDLYLRMYMKIEAGMNFCAEYSNAYLHEKYEEYKNQWVEDHISPERRTRISKEYNNSEECSYMTFGQYVEKYGYDGELYACYDEWLDCEFEEEKHNE